MHPLRSLTMIGLACSAPAPSWAGGQPLQPNEVMLLYNSYLPDSAQIAATYLAHHPGVIPCDIAVPYWYVQYPPGQVSTPPPLGINNQFITRATFRALFLDSERTPFRQCLAQNPQILAMATTRGLPAAVSDNFNPNASAGPLQGGIWCSLESALTIAGQGPSANPFSLQWIQNPYRGDHGMTIREFLEQPGDSWDIGDLFLVTRLDSNDPDGYPVVNAEGNCIDRCLTATDGVVQMIERAAASAPVNKFAVTTLIDAHSQTEIDDYFMRAAAVRLFNSGWCVLTDTTCNLVEGAGDSHYDASDEAVSDRPFILILSKGTGGNDPTDNPACEGLGNWIAGYLIYYETHPMAIWFAEDSAAAWTMHSQDEYSTGFNQGQIIDWIAGGGSFAIGTVREPGGLAIRIEDTVGAFMNLGLTWSEATFAGLAYLAPSAFVSVGDPFARLTVYQPDISGDDGAAAGEPPLCGPLPNRIVDACDEAQVINNLNSPGPAGDITADGLVDADDLAEVQAADVFGRNCTAPPTAFALCGTPGCPDVAPDFVINVSDLLALLEKWGPCPVLEDATVPCAGDSDGNCSVGVAELLDILGRWGTLLLDANRDGVVDCVDVDYACLVLHNCIAPDPNCDVNCDDAVTQADINLLRNQLIDCPACGGCP
jgi:hypothetical protein